MAVSHRYLSSNDGAKFPLLIFVECKLGIEDFLVLELLRWFKQAFFSWVNCLPCSRCGGSTQNQGSLSPTTDDLRWGAQRVENHFCQSCQLSTRFPRFVFVLTSPLWTPVYFLDMRNFIVICCFSRKDRHKKTRWSLIINQYSHLASFSHSKPVCLVSLRTITSIHPLI